MKMQKLKALLLVGILCSIFLHTSNLFAGGLITHIGMAQEIINRAKAGDSSIPSDIATLITKSRETERAFRSGALDGDILNFTVGNMADAVHSKESAAIAKALLKNAKTDVEKAYAYGWITHYPGDIVTHPEWVNDLAANKGEHGPNPPVVWDKTNPFYKDTNWEHVKAEKKGDWYALNKFGFNEYEYIDPESGVSSTIKNPKLDIDIDIPVFFLRKALKDAYGLSKVSPSILYEAVAEMNAQLILNTRAENLAYAC